MITLSLIHLGKKMSTINKRHCPICKKPVVGRSDKKFCSTACKSNYHQRLSAHTEKATARIDKILHRNRSILQELLGKRRVQIKIPLIELESKKFNFNYITKYHINNRGKEYRYVYDIAYMTFSKDEVLIIRVNKKWTSE